MREREREKEREKKERERESEREKKRERGYPKKKNMRIQRHLDFCRSCIIFVEAASLTLAVDRANRRLVLGVLDKGSGREAQI